MRAIDVSLYLQGRERYPFIAIQPHCNRSSLFIYYIIIHSNAVSLRSPLDLILTRIISMNIRRKQDAEEQCQHRSYERVRILCA